MKTLFFRFSFILSLALVMFACSNTDEEIIEDEGTATLTASESTIAFTTSDEFTGGRTVTISTDKSEIKDLKAEVETAAASWLTTEIVAGATAKTATVRIKVTANTGDAREGKITVKATKATDVVITVTQVAFGAVATATLEVSEQTVLIDAVDGGDHPLILYLSVTTSESTFLPVIAPDGRSWLETNMGDVNAPNNLKITASTNSSTASRETTITLSAGTAEDVVITVTQSGYTTASNPLGLWIFEDADITKATYGSPLEFYKWLDYGTEHNAGILAELEGYPARIDGPVPSSHAIALKWEDHIKVLSPSPLEQLEVFTLLFDVRLQDYPEFVALFQPIEDNNTDSSLFLKRQRQGDFRGNSSLGKQGLNYGEYTLEHDSTWYRIIMVIDKQPGGTFKDPNNNDVELTNKLYVNGSFYYENFGIKPRQVATMGIREYFYVGLDDSNEDGPIDIANLAIWDRALSLEEIVALGDPSDPL
ncbi:MAG: hypothetical protein EZS26_003607 [Candidatus Ordinivivax streblomastigis]|uniref:BACON domain-containing protein n=1 Tax=Candidatus Ordinivivax streblomastigis TaxID=2540710 RepID=A0A5M8NY50_9BACT|nr:MAG: hypothetical protein EZS26_003607 [Candidatus Ordinivivax streblomastigis]